MRNVISPPLRRIKFLAPLIEECPINLECRVKSVTPLGSHDMFLAEIVGVDINEEYLDADGKLHMEQCGLASYMHGEYFALGKKVAVLVTVCASGQSRSPLRNSPKI